MTRYLRERTLYGPLIASAPHRDLGLVIVVPAKREPDLLQSLRSLENCDPPGCAVEVIVVFNSAEGEEEVHEENERTLAEMLRWTEGRRDEGRQFHALSFPRLPRKHAGVGLARKIGMDEACRRLEAVERPEGVISCFDADSECDANYLVELERFFREMREVQACSIRYEHPLPTQRDPALASAIAGYELHLRCFVEAQRWAGFPFAIQTIGSSMAVRADAYQAHNGMNRRQAGEDFYFLHKFSVHERVGELVTTCVRPSSRVSDRVPFGTGRAMGEALARNTPGISTYGPSGFQELQKLLVPAREGKFLRLEEAPAALGEFLRQAGYDLRIAEIVAQTKSDRTRILRFFRWFDGFLIMKFLHFFRDERRGSDIPVETMARWLVQRRGEDWGESLGVVELLNQFRKSDLQGGNRRVTLESGPQIVRISEI